jgi:protein TonB
VLTQPKTPDDLVDLTDGLVTGSSSTVAGGRTAAQGESSPGSSRGSARGPVSPVSSLPASPSSDRSRRPALAGGFEWACPFPSEADAAGIDSAVVSIRVDVDASGAVKDVTVQSDPGHGFGRAARRCATTKQWTPALDRDGTPVDGAVVVHVRFER